MLKTNTFLLLTFVVYINAQHPVAQTPLGSVKGSIRKSFQGRTFAAFEGIPYAKPPIGDRRFEPPEYIEPWHGIWDARHPTICAQKMGINSDLNITNGDEDCLHINVYLPREKPNPDENLDVVVHIHGGAYMYGQGHMYANPEILMDKELVFVTFNYRLGIFGFLSTEDDVVPGNNGLKDQVKALEWIQKNIGSFGGNPDSVTLTGGSAGAGCVHFHYFSEMSKGLFHRGFSQSGVALNPFSIQEGALEKANILAHAVGCSTTNTQILAQCLKQRPYKQLLSQQDLFFGYSSLPISPFAPVVEKGSKPFLKAHPYELLKKGEVNDVPWIASTAADEGHMLELFIPDRSFNFESNWNWFAPIFLDFNYTIGQSLWKSTSERIKDFYFGSSEINKENIPVLYKMYGDRTFSVDAEKAVRMQAEVTNSPVYYYVFSYPGTGSKYVSHGADGKYFFGPFMTDSPKLDEDELQMRSVFLEMLVSFAKTGTPSMTRIDWKPTKSDKLTYLDIKSYRREEIRLNVVDEVAPVKFWQFLEKLEHGDTILTKNEL